MPGTTSEYFTFLSKDKRFQPVLAGQEPFVLTTKRNVPLRLISSIMSQQLSTRVAEVILKRFLKLFPATPTPALILALPLEKLRAIGLSNAKAGYVHNVARFALEEGLDHKTLRKMTNDEVIEHLTKIKGVGRWTAEMILMFVLGREDVFAADDLGIQNAMIKAYRLDKSDKKKLRENMLRLSAKWSPYRTYACVHLWRWKDNTPV